MKNKPERTCIICRKKFDKRDLLRVVRDKSGQIHFDPTGKQNGRGAYICNNQDCIDKFFKKSFLERSFKMQIPSEQVKTVRDEIKTHLDKFSRTDSEAKQ